MWIELVAIIAALVLIYIIYGAWAGKSIPVEQEYYLASDVYTKLLTNENNPFNLMTDFSLPVPKDGPTGESIDQGTLETYDLDIIEQLQGS
jgi:hypothetical protein